jgi:TetR/AcrR family transcriptional regulator, transcriptional repressor for nem operon
MSRPKAFDPDEAMQEAMEAFWERGYAATSVNDLLEEMGLNRGSLYGTFGDKKQLFLSVLDKYYKQRVEAVRELLDRPGSAKQALRSLVEGVACDCTGQNAKRGCLAAKAAMELAPHDKDVASWLKRFHRRNVAMVAKVVERGQQQGEISRSLGAEDAARFLLNCMAGMRITATISPSSSELSGVVELILKVLEQ